jgi:hypothetical protein
VTTIQIPPDGVVAKLPFEIPAPGDLTTLGGVRVYFTFNLEQPSAFYPKLLVGGENKSLSQSASGPLSRTYIAQFPEALSAPQQAEIWINDGGTLQPGNDVTVYAWGAQTESGTGALNPDEGGEPSITTATIEVGNAEVITWQEWNRLTGANQGEEGS